MPNLGKHPNSQACKNLQKKRKAICRFNFPLLPMPYNVFLDPLHDEEEDAWKKKLSESCKICYSTTSK